MKKTLMNKVLPVLLAFAMLLGINGIGTVASAATKAPKLSAKTVTLNAGASKKIKLKNKPKKATVTWSSSNKKVAKVKSGKITAVKKGSAKITCRVKYKKGKKTVTKKLSVKVKVKAAAKKVTATNAPAATVPPVATQTPTIQPTTAPTNAPDVSSDISNLGEEHESANGILTKDNGLMRKDMTSQQMTKFMGLAWNLGNQLETYNPKAKTVRACETSAGNPVAKQLTMDGLKAYGVNAVRIPVGWSNLMSTDGTYTISEDYMNRVEEVMNYALNNEMYVIINIHWDGGWWGMFGDADESVRAEAWKKYEAIWTQLSNRYKEYSDRLIFEGANEELGARLNDDWAHPEKGESDGTGTLTEAETYDVSLQINQKFIDIVRASGGNNVNRHLLIPGHGTILNDTCSEKFVMPTDIEENGNNKLSISIHYYEPTDYGIARTSTNSWGYRDSWGTEDDYAYMANQMKKIERFTNDGYGVILGECGVAVTNKDNIPEYLKELFRICKEKNYCPVMWDEGGFYSRKGGYFTFTDIGDVFKDFTGSNPVIPETAVLDKTGVPKLPESANKDPKVVYTWEGEFMRHTDDVTATELGLDATLPGIGETTSVTDGLTADFNDEFWHSHFNCDWTQFKNPCIRVYPKDNTQSQTADLQVAYCEDPKSQWVFERDYAQIDVDGNIAPQTAWVGKYIELDKDALAKYPWVWLTTNTYTGVSFVKVEVCDAAYNADGTEFVEAK